MPRFLGSVSGLFAVALLAGCAGVRYSPSVTELKSIPAVAVKVSYQADGIYQVAVRNHTKGSISLLWNSSVYVNTAGEAVRLINIRNLDHFPEVAPTGQTPSQLVRGARLKTWFVGESWIDYARRGVTPRPRDNESKALLYLAFDIKGRKIYWKGEVSFVPVR